MSTINDGGPVYPTVPVPTEADYKRDKLERLRDEFAMAALEGLSYHYTVKDAVKLAYEMADAMLRAREVKP